MIIKQEHRENTRLFVEKIKQAKIDLDRLYSQRESAIIALYKEGHTIAEIARLFEMQYQNVSKICAPYKS